MDNKILAGYLDGTILSPKALPADIVNLARDAVNYGFASVCVNAVNLPVVIPILNGSKVKACTVAGFPLGETTSAMKAAEAEKAAALGASEIDMVASVSRLKAGEYSYYLNEIEIVKSAIGNNCLKVIIETCYLSQTEIRLATELCVAGGADFVKTSTGFGTRGASLEDIALICRTLVSAKETAGINRKIGVKASGGIATKDFALELIKCGATRLGVSKYLEIFK